MAEEALRCLDEAVRRSASLLSAFEDVSPIAQAEISSFDQKIDTRLFSETASVPPQDFPAFLLNLLELPKQETAKSKNTRSPIRKPAPPVSRSENFHQSPALDAAATQEKAKIPTHFFRKFRDSKRAFDFRNL